MAGAARAAFAAALLAASLGAAGALRSKAAAESEAAISDWKYYPPNAQVGIVTGGPAEAYSKMNFGSQSASIMLKWAQKHGYAFFVDKRLDRFSDRKKYWNKVMLMHKLLREVPVLVWMDPEIIIKKLDTSLEDLIATAKCDGSEQKQWDSKLPHKARNDTFLMLNSDKSPHRYLVNANTGMVILRRTPEAFSFLSKIWDAGKDPQAYEHHHDELGWLRKDPKHPDHGWPFEQGAFWDVLAKEPSYLRNACIAAGNHFQAVRSYLYSKGDFAVSEYGAGDQAAREQAHLTLVENNIKAEIH